MKITTKVTLIAIVITHLLFFSCQKGNDNLRQNEETASGFFRLLEQFDSLSAENDEAAYDTIVSATKYAEDIPDHSLILKAYIRKAQYEFQHADGTYAHTLLEAKRIADTIVPLDYQDATNLFYLLATIEYEKANHDSSTFFLKKSAFYAAHHFDFYSISRAYNMLGLNYMKLGLYDDAIQYYQTALKFSKIALNKSMTNYVIQNIALTYSYAQRNQDAVKMYYFLLMKKKNEGDDKNITALYNSLGVAYLNLNNYKNALYYFKQAVRNDSLKGSITRFSIMAKNNIALVMQKMGDYKSALEIYDISQPGTPLSNKIAVLINLSEIYIRSGNYFNAEKSLNQADSLAIYTQSIEDKINVLKMKMKLYEEKGSYESAYQTTLLLSKLSDSVRVEERDYNINALEVKYESDLKDNMLQKNHLIIANSELIIKKNQRQLFFYILLSVALFVLVIVILFANNKFKRDLILISNQKKHIEELSLKNQKLSKSKFDNVFNNMTNPVLIFERQNLHDPQSSFTLTEYNKTAENDFCVVNNNGTLEIKSNVIAEKIYSVLGNSTNSDHTYIERFYFDDNKKHYEIKSFNIEEGVYAVIFNDITDQKNYELSLENTVKMHEELVYITSHDLQVPLISIGGYVSELMNEYADKLDENAIQMLERLKVNSSQMHELITVLLDISRVSTRKPEMLNINMRELFEKVFKYFNLVIVQKNINIKIENLPDIESDQYILERVLRNVIVNAINYGAKNIVVGCNHSTYFVKDDGIGVEENFLERIFKPGERIREIEVNGTGMGLFYCRKAISQLGGKIWAESEGKSKGTTIYFKI